MRGFYDDYKSKPSKNENADRPALIRRSFGTAFFEFLAKFFMVIIHIIVITLSSIGFTVLINANLRAMLFEIIQNIF